MTKNKKELFLLAIKFLIIFIIIGIFLYIAFNDGGIGLRQLKLHRGGLKNCFFMVQFLLIIMFIIGILYKYAFFKLNKLRDLFGRHLALIFLKLLF